MKMYVVLIAQRRQQRAQALFAAGERDHLDLRAGEIAVGGDQRHVIDRRADEEGRGSPVGSGVVSAL